MALAAYLQAQKQAFLSLPASAPPPASVTLVSGNESGDADSLACALGVGYLLGKDTFPLLQTRARDLALRPENTLALRTAGVATSDILTLDDVQSTLARLTNTSIKLVLVDHNRVTSNLAPYHPDVIGVLDHHVDEGLYATASPRIICPPTECGSCSSLVTRAYRRGWLSHRHDMTPDVARLLFSASLIDTHNYDAAIGKAHAVDYESAAFLADLAGVPIAATPAAGVTISAQALQADPSASVDSAGLSHALAQAKNDVSGLDTSQLLTRDYKQYSVPSSDAGRAWAIGLATVPERLEHWITREGQDRFVESCRAFAAEHHLDLLGILTSFEADGTFQREVAIFSPRGDKAFTAFAQAAEHDTSDALDLTPIPSLNDDLRAHNFVVWQQRQTRATRKQVAPAFTDVAAKVVLE